MPAWPLISATSRSSRGLSSFTYLTRSNWLSCSFQVKHPMFSLASHCTKLPRCLFCASDVNSRPQNGRGLLRSAMRHPWHCVKPSSGLTAAAVLRWKLLFIDRSASQGSKASLTRLRRRKPFSNLFESLRQLPCRLAIAFCDATKEELRGNSATFGETFGSSSLAPLRLPHSGLEAWRPHVLRA